MHTPRQIAIRLEAGEGWHQVAAGESLPVPDTIHRPVYSRNNPDIKACRGIYFWTLFKRFLYMLDKSGGYREGSPPLSGRGLVGRLLGIANEIPIPRGPPLPTRGAAPLTVPSTPHSGADGYQRGPRVLAKTVIRHFSCTALRVRCLRPPASEDVGEGRPDTRNGALAAQL